MPRQRPARGSNLDRNVPQNGLQFTLKVFYMDILILKLVNNGVTSIKNYFKIRLLSTQMQYAANLFNKCSAKLLWHGMIGVS
jgi:hypothetical protein